MAFIPYSSFSVLLKLHLETIIRLKVKITFCVCKLLILPNGGSHPFFNLSSVEGQVDVCRQSAISQSISQMSLCLETW